MHGSCPSYLAHTLTMSSTRLPIALNDSGPPVARKASTSCNSSQRSLESVSEKPATGQLTQRLKLVAAHSILPRILPTARIIGPACMIRLAFFPNKSGAASGEGCAY